MKRIFTISIAALLAVTSFAQVNVWRKNGYVSQFEKTTVDSITFSTINPYTARERARAGEPTAETRDMFDLQKEIYVGLENYGYNRHCDFGYAATCILLDTRGQDLVGLDNGYNWFRSWGNPSDWGENTWQTTIGMADYMLWYTYYKPILAANYVIATHTSGSEEDTYAVAQAKALRAFEYMQLAQAYQVSYSESSLNLPCVPIVLDTISAYFLLNMPRATVAQVYAQIKADLDEACNNLEGYMRPDKSVINQAVAYGLRARCNLLVHKYNQAASDAEQALLLSGATPLTIAEVSQPGFADASAHNVLWANIINETDYVVYSGLVNWPSFLSMFYSDGYAGYGYSVYSISSELYDQIPSSDVRKGWWLNVDLQSPLLNAAGYSERASAIQESIGREFATVKFGTGDGTISGHGAAAADWIVMRAEELVLLRAEALTRAGKDGASVLTSFISTYRDPDYDINAHGLSVADEIWWQRRVELWGEGFAFQDLMRLHKGALRTNSLNWPTAWKQDVPADDARFPVVIPQKEADYQAVAVWQQGEKDLYNTYYLNTTRVDSITVGEAKEMDDVRMSEYSVNGIYYSGFNRQLTFTEGKMDEVNDTILIQFVRDHNIVNPINVPLIIDASPVFSGAAIPTSISFEGGKTYTYGIAYVETQFVVHVNALPAGTYRFSITIPDEYCQGTVTSYYSQSFTYEIIVKEPDIWDITEIRQGVFVDDAIIAGLYNVEPSVPWVVNYQMASLGNGKTGIRIINPFIGAGTEQDEHGIYEAFPYNDPGDWDDSKDYIFMLTIDDATGEVTIDDAELGIDWGYGMMFLRNYPTAIGAYDATAGSVTFDVANKKLVLGMGEKLYSYAGFRFYVSKEAYVADNP